MKIFLSYASEQSELAQEVALALRAERYHVFISRSSLSPSEAYNAEIRQAIRKSHGFVFLISPHSVSPGRYTLTELEFAEQKWPKPWSHVFPVMAVPTLMTAIPPYLRAGTVLQPQGNLAAETVEAVNRSIRPRWRRILQHYGTHLLVLLTLAVLGAGVALWKYLPPYLLSPETPELEHLFRQAKIQQDTGHYEEAWKLLEQARSKAPDNAGVDENAAKLAMAWLDNAGYTEGKGSYTAIVDTVLPALSRCSVSPDKVYAADCLAHMGWSDFLKSREGSGGLDPEQFYQRALALDPDNVYAHAFWGHWLIVNGNHLAEAQRHFIEALKSGRKRRIVREFQLAALQWVGTDENRIELIRACNEMRKENDSLPVELRSRLISHIYFMGRDGILAKFDQILPAEEHLATFQWLIQGIDSTESLYQTFFLARLREAVGDCKSAQYLYASLLGSDMLSGKIREGIERCKRKTPLLKSEVELLTESISDQNALVRRRSVEGLSVLLADGAKIDMNIIVSALRDADAEVRAAAAKVLARSGRQAVAPMVDLLGSEEPADQALAARILAMMGAESKAALPSLVRVLGNSDGDVQQAVLDALANIGPDADVAVAPITKLLSANPSFAMRKSLIYTLGEIGPPSRQAVPLIIEALTDPSDREGFLNADAADALGKIGPGAASAVPALIEALGSDNVRLPSRATAALGNIGAEAKAAIPALIEAMEREDPEHKQNQAETLGKIAQALAIRKDRSALKVLRAALRAEENAGLDLATISPLREAVGFLEARNP